MKNFRFDAPALWYMTQTGTLYITYPDKTSEFYADLDIPHPYGWLESVSKLTALELSRSNNAEFVAYLD